MPLSVNSLEQREGTLSASLHLVSSSSYPRRVKNPTPTQTETGLVAMASYLPLGQLLPLLQYLWASENVKCSWATLLARLGCRLVPSQVIFLALQFASLAQMAEPPFVAGKMVARNHRLAPF